MTQEIDITGLDKAEVLAALYNASQPLGLGVFHFDPRNMTADEARKELEVGTYFDYLKGRVMKIDLRGDSLRPYAYDRDNGQGAAAHVIASLRAKLKQDEPQGYEAAFVDAAAAAHCRE